MSTDNFHEFAQLVKNQFDEMAQNDLFVVDISHEELWQTYLDSFPEGTNPIFRERTEHNCSCCRHFIRDIGNVVSLANDQMTTIWDVNAPEPYKAVANALSNLIRSEPIKTTFLTYQQKIGTPSNVEQLRDGTTIEFKHFNCIVPQKFVSTSRLTDLSKIRASYQVIRRGLNELTIEAVDQVLELCEQNEIYRGQQHLKTIRAFSEAQYTYKQLSSKYQDWFIWKNVKNLDLKIRNTAIGQLLIDLSEGESLEDSVRSYEAITAPQNYRRSSAIITKSMVSKAVERIRELDLEDSLKRRFATAADLSVNDVLYVNRSTAIVMRDSLSDLLMPETKTSHTTDRSSPEIGIDEFFTNIVPNATKIEVLFENKLTGNLASLTAPIDDRANSLFQWPNNYAWSYKGNITDSIKEKVRKAGGNVTGFGRVSLSWWNTDDLDIHVTEPYGAHIYYGTKSPHEHGGLGTLDVDMNVYFPVRDAVENITWPFKMKDGVYFVAVNNYAKRESIDIGFTIEIEISGQLSSYTYEKPLRANETKEVCRFNIKNNELINIIKTNDIEVGHLQKEEWAIKTGEFHEVSMIVLSPNFWNDTAYGNKHWFFILSGCTNPEPTRGIYNEFLRQELLEHRKVFEVLADKTMCAVSDQQLSGLGFSSTIRNQFVVRVQHESTTKQYKVNV